LQTDHKKEVIMHHKLIRSWIPLLKERIMKRYLLVATLVGIVMTAFVRCTDADLFGGSKARGRRAPFKVVLILPAR